MDLWNSPPSVGLDKRKEYVVSKMKDGYVLQVSPKRVRLFKVGAGYIPCAVQIFRKLIAENLIFLVSEDEDESVYHLHVAAAKSKAEKAKKAAAKKTAIIEDDDDADAKFLLEVPLVEEEEDDVLDDEEEEVDDLLDIDPELGIDGAALGLDDLDEEDALEGEEEEEDTDDSYEMDEDGLED